MSRFASALSEHPLPAAATGEVVGRVAEQLGGEAPDLAVVFVTGNHVGAVEDIAAAIRSALTPGALVGTTAVSVVGDRREVEETPAVSLWAARIGPVTPVRLDVEQTPQGWAINGLPPDAAGTLLLLPDPYSFPVDAFLAQLGEANPDLVVVGGLASAAAGPGGNRLVIDDVVTPGGAVGVLLPPAVAVGTVVSQGCRPVGRPMVVTRSERNQIHELAGQSGLARLKELVVGLSEDDRQLLQRGLHIGVVIDEQQIDFDRGDFLIRGVLGIDQGSEALTVGDEVPVGATVQFQIRDAASADEDLRALMVDARADGALLFTCNGRGTAMFPSADHDATVVSDALDGAPLSGMFCAGEIGPVGGRNFLHGFTASVVLFPG